jgi:hypothetical protein
MSTPLHIMRDINGQLTSGTLTGLDFPTYTQTALLTADTVKTFTVPQASNGKMIAYFGVSKAADLFVKSGSATTLVVPTGTVTLDTSELNPSPRIVYAGQTIQFLSPQADTYLTVTYYDVPTNN